MFPGDSPALLHPAQEKECHGAGNQDKHGEADHRHQLYLGVKQHGFVRVRRAHVKPKVERERKADADSARL